MMCSLSQADIKVNATRKAKSVKCLVNKCYAN